MSEVQVLREKKTWWNKDTVVESIRALHAADVTLNSQRIKSDKNPKTRQILTNVIGKRTSGYGLLSAAYIYWGSWDEALKTAGVDPIEVRKDNKYWSKELTIECLKALARRNILLNPSSVNADIPAVKDILSQITKKDVVGTSLVNSARKQFGSWKAALKAAGFDPIKLKNPTQRWSKEIIIQCIQEVSKADLPLNWGNISSDKENEIEQILFRVTGRKVSKVALSTSASSYFGSWRNALSEAGLNSEKYIRIRSYWTKALVIKCLQALYNANIQVSGLKVSKDRSPETRKILSELCNRSISGTALSTAAIKLMGSWDNALKETGLPVEKISRKHAYRIAPDLLHQDARFFWTKERVIEGIKGLVNAGIPISATKINSDRSQLTSRILFYSIGVHSTGKKLYSSAIRRFGKWDGAILASGFDPNKLNHLSWFWTKELVIEAIKALEEAGVSLNAGSLGSDKGYLTLKVLGRVNPKIRSAKSLINRGTAFFGSWEKTLEAAGIDPNKICRRIWRKEIIVKSIQALHRANIPLQSSKISKDNTEETKKIIFEAVGVKANGRALNASARWNLGSWDRALTEANINPRLIRAKKFYWHKPGITRAIKCLHKLDIPLNSSEMIKNKSESSEILKNKIGRSVSTFGIYKNAVKKFGSWDAALFKAGLHPCVIRLKANHLDRNKEEIVKTIMLTHEAGIHLNRSSIIKNSAAIKVITCAKFENVISGHSLINAAVSSLGSWDEALRQAKFNPDEIRLRSRTTSNLSIIPHQAEWVKDDNGRWRKQLYFGEPTKNPEQLYEENEAHERLEKAIGGLSPEDQNIIEAIMNSDIELGDVGAKVKAESIGLQLSESRIAKILGALKSSFEFLREMESAHQLLFRHLPEDSKDTLLELLDLFESLNALIEDRKDKLYEIARILETIEFHLLALFPTVEHLSAEDVQAIQIEIMAQLTKIRQAFEEDAEPSIIKWLIACLKKPCVEYCRKIKDALDY